MNEAPETQTTNAKYYLHQATGDRVVINPYEQERNVLNPHGFVDMQPLYGFIKELYEEADRENFNAHFESTRNFLTITAKYEPQLKASISVLEITYGSIRQVPSHSMEPIKREQVLGVLTCALYRKSESITVLLSKDGKGNSQLPQSFLRSLTVNGLLKLPRKEFDVSPILSLT